MRLGVCKQCERAFVDESTEGGQERCEDCVEYDSRVPAQRFKPPSTSFEPPKAWSPVVDKEDQDGAFA